MNTTVSGFCNKCKSSVELEKVVITLDNKSNLVTYRGICPICGRELEEEDF